MPLALLLDLRRHGGWARVAVLSRAEGTPAEVEAVAQLLASRRRECRIAGLRAGASSALLDVEEAYAIAERDVDTGVAGHAVRAAIRITLRSLRAEDDAAREDAVARFRAFLRSCRDAGLGRIALTAAHVEGLLRPEDLARLAVSHHERGARRYALTTLLAEHDPIPFLDALSTAPDAVVRAAAVGRLRSAGRVDDLARHLTDSNDRVRAVACRELRATGTDPYPAYRALCADPAAVTPAAITELAERRSPEDVPLFHELTRHALGPVRARALAALRMLGALPGDGPVAFADDPDPSVRSTALGAVHHSPDALRALLTARHEDVRARALNLLASRHGLDRQEALPFLEDPAARVTRVAQDVVRPMASRVPLSSLLRLAAPGRPLAQRAAGLALITHQDDAGELLAALRLADDPDFALRWTARDRVVWVLRRLDEEVGGPYGAEIRRLIERHAAEIPGWYEEIQRRNRVARQRGGPAR